jgi:hypothetical protein
MSEHEYTTLRAKPLNQLLQIPAQQMAYFLATCSPKTKQALALARWNR